MSQARAIEEESPLLHSPTEERETSVPEDKYHVTYWLMFYLGVAMLFPWNTFITASTYWEYRFKDTAYEGSYNNYITLTTQISNIVFQAILLKFMHLFSLRLRILLPFALLLVMFIIQASLVKVGHLNADTFMGFLAVSCMFAGAATSALQGGMFGLAGLLPGVYTQSLLLGQALAGLIVAGLNVLFLRGGVDLGFNPAFVYFITSCIVAFFALFAFVWVVRTPVMKYYAQHDTVESSPAKPKEYEIRRTFDAIYDQLLIVGYNFFITLLVFPSLTSKIIDHNQWLVQADGTNLFVPVFTFLLFNLGDVVGRTLSAYGNLFTAYNLRYAVLVRTLFVPAFLLCDVKFSIVSAVLFNSDLWYILFMILFSVSSGYLGAQCMMFGPQCADVRDRECAGTMMAFSLTIGLLIGSWLSFLLIAD